MRGENGSLSDLEGGFPCLFCVKINDLIMIHYKYNVTFSILRFYADFLTFAESRHKCTIYRTFRKFFVLILC